MVRFDAYTATTVEVDHVELASLFDLPDGPANAKQRRGFHMFDHGIDFTDRDGHAIGSVQWGGRHAPRSMLEVKGERTPEVVERLRSACEHRVTRMDTCADFDAPGAFKRLLGVCMRIKRRHRLIGRRDGDWQDYPERGRTQYLGSPQSTTMLRLYEKGKQAEYQHLERPDWVRAEVQVRPPGPNTKRHFSTLSALECWGASGWSMELGSEILAEHIDPHPAGTTWRPSDRDRALGWMCKQYGAHLLSLKDDCGSWEALGLTLSEMLKTV